VAYFETSARENINVDDAFFQVARRAFDVEIEESLK